jgi:hypothetical protein
LNAIKRQGTTSVVPQTQQKRWALAPAQVLSITHKFSPHDDAQLDIDKTI